MLFCYSEGRESTRFFVMWKVEIVLFNYETKEETCEFVIRELRRSRALVI